MTKKKNQESKMEHYLSQLPEIRDKRNKSEVYQSIQRSINKEKTYIYPEKRNWIPIFATVCTVFLVVILLQNIHFNEIEESSTDDTVQLESSDESAELFQSNDIQTDLIEDEEIAQIRELEEFNYLLSDLSNDMSGDITIPLVTYQGQSIVPIHLPLQQDKDVNNLTELIDKVEQYIDLEDDQLDFPPIHSFVIEEDGENKQAVVKIPDELKWVDSSTNRYLLENSLHYRYQSTDVEKVIFENNHPITEQYKDGILPIIDLDRIPVKIYKAGSSTYLLPVLHQSIGQFSEALEEMKVDEEAFYIYHSIPKDARIQLEEQNRQHIHVDITSSIIGQNQETVTMVEAVIATAHLFGYAEITLDIGLDSLGKYVFDKPISTDKTLNFIANERIHTNSQR